MAARRAVVKRKTRETDIELSLGLDGEGRSKIATGIGFLDHMLTAFATHGRFDLDVRCKGDLHVDAHHSVEDVGIALGQALKQALGDKQGVVRFGHAYCPLDEALSRCVIDLSGRPWLHFEVKFKAQRVGDMPTELFEDLLLGPGRPRKAQRPSRRPPRPQRAPHRGDAVQGVVAGPVDGSGARPPREGRPKHQGVAMTRVGGR